MMENSKMRFQKEVVQNIVDPLSLKQPPITQTCSETTSPQGITASHESIQPSKYKFFSSIQPMSPNSSPQSKKPPNQVRTIEGRTQAPQDKFDLRQTPKENENKMNQLRFFKTASKKGNIDCGLFRCRALCMCLPGFGKSTKTEKPQVKAIKGENEKDHSENHVTMSSTSSTFSFEKLEHDSGVTLMNHENHWDGSTSSYFELPSQILK